MKDKITYYIKDFLNDPNNFKNIKNRSEADFQFELGYFLKAIKNCLELFYKCLWV